MWKQAIRGYSWRGFGKVSRAFGFGALPQALCDGLQFFRLLVLNLMELIKIEKLGLFCR